MGLIKLEPLSEIEVIMDRAMGWPMPRLGAGLAMSEWGPRVDISESDGTYLFKADLPGMNKQDVSVTLSGDMLTIKGERKRESEETKPHFHRMERSTGSFSRSFSLPENADATALKAAAKEGQLTVTIPKKAPTTASGDAVQVPVE